MLLFLIFSSDITNPKAPPNSKEATKSFNYDYSYLSLDVSILISKGKKKTLFFLIYCHLKRNIYLCTYILYVYTIN